MNITIEVPVCEICGAPQPGRYCKFSSMDQLRRCLKRGVKPDERFTKHFGKVKRCPICGNLKAEHARCEGTIKEKLIRKTVATPCHRCGSYEVEQGYCTGRYHFPGEREPALCGWRREDG